jgi:hypothetical protein
MFKVIAERPRPRLRLRLGKRSIASSNGLAHRNRVFADGNCVAPIYKPGSRFGWRCRQALTGAAAPLKRSDLH